jgi:hypothetical protein
MERKMITRIVAGAAMLFSVDASATMLEVWDTAKLTQESKSVQIGEVTSRYSSWDPEKKMIYTYVNLRVDQTLKGKPAQEVQIRLPGGEADGIRMIVHGVASFGNQERAVVFLQNDADGAPVVVGMAQGKYRIIRNKATGEETAVFQKPENLEFYTRGLSGQSRHVVSAPVERRVPLRLLIEEIQSAIRAEGTAAH